MAVECEFRPLTEEEIDSFLREIENAVDEYETPPPPNTFANFRHALETAKHLYEEAGRHYMPSDKDKFVPVEEQSARNWLKNRCDLKDFENDANPQDIWSQARVWIAQQEWLLRTVLYLYEELRRIKRYLPLTGFHDGYDPRFKHKVTTQPGSCATLSDDEKEVRVTVYFAAKHWIPTGHPDEEEFPYANECTHGMGFIISVNDFWMLATGGETPMRSCRGRKCGEELKLLDETNKRLSGELTRSRHAEAVLLEKLESVGHPITEDDLRKIVFSAPTGEEDGPPSNQAT